MSGTIQKGKIIVFIGLPASGKSTAAKERMEDTRIMRVNRDAIRSMLFKHWRGRKEQVVTEIETQAIVSAVNNGFDIIIDDTNLHPNTRSKWQALANKLGTVLVEESFSTPLEECIQRDSNRIGKAHVGRAVIENMALKYNLIPPVPADQKVVIFDVDGTLADNTHRAHLVDGSQKKDHALYFSLADKDTPIDKNIKWAQDDHYHQNRYVLVVSGRPADLGSDNTVEWLRRQGVVYQHIFMRAGGDYRNDDVVKQEILDNILKWVPKEQIEYVVDDRPRVIRMWRANGLLCHDVGFGEEF